MAQPVEIKLAKEEEQPKQEHEIPYFDALVAALSEADRERAEADPLDVLIIVRGFANETPRMEATLEAWNKVVTWRNSIGYYEFFDNKLPGAEDFYKWWPESIHGCDKYGHFLQCLRAGDVDADSLCGMDHAQVEKLQGQKMRAYTLYKKRLSAQTGVQRYKSSLVIDLSGASLSLTRSAKRDLLKRIFDVGTHYYPETMWKIYVVNTPMLFRAIWSMVKPWLHPITAAKVNLLGGYDSAIKHMEGDGIKKDQIPDWMHGGSKGINTKEFVDELIAQHAAKGEVVNQ